MKSKDYTKYNGLEFKNIGKHFQLGDQRRLHSGGSTLTAPLFIHLTNAEGPTVFR